MINELVSVIVPIYKQEDYLIECIESLLKQTYSNIEIILVDDGSPDKCPDICDQFAFKDKRIHVVHKKNGGVSSARNAGIQIARGKYIAFLDSDDKFFPDKIFKCLSYLNVHKDYIACASWCEIFGTESKIYQPRLSDFDYYRCGLLFRNDPTIFPSSLVVKKENALQISFDEKLHYGEDYKYLVQLSEMGIIGMICEPLIYYRKHKTQATNEHRNKTLRKNDPLSITAMGYIFNKLGLVFSKKERLHFLDKEYSKIDLYYYKKVLNKIIDCNKKCAYYKHNSLVLRCKKQWEFVIKKVNSPLSLLRAFFFASGDRLMVFRVKWRQIKNFCLNRRRIRRQK